MCLPRVSGGRRAIGADHVHFSTNARALRTESARSTVCRRGWQTVFRFNAREVYVSRLQAEHLYKVFGRRPDQAVQKLENGANREELRADGTTAAVIDASFTVEPGHIFVVMGLSGSGKSTLLRMLNGLLEPTAGRVLFDGEDLTALSPRDLRDVRSKKISMVFQHFALFPHRSVLENAAYGLEVQGVSRVVREERAAQALELTGLAGWEKSWPDELSGGMQQRVGLARALATDADLLLMDESFSALDPLIRRDMQDQLLELQKRLKKTIVFITHDLNEAMRLGDRIAVMRDGRIVQQGTAEDILVRPANDYVASFIQDVDRSRVLTAGSIMEAPEKGRSHEDLVAEAPATVTAETPVAELFTPCSTSGLAVAVTDADGGLIGMVPRTRLLAALGEEPQIDEVPAVPAAAGEVKKVNADA
ncbi:glycine betaine/proline transport system ATP-binding protein [Streptomyces sp. DvalAA-21]|nr:glycine betaine/proline transport system ATP-binding protein [Streptomyces sp. DvalAA-21]RAJ26932.1 glycine betaine/proline transport system ATP-binding protein [Streptomyces sp. DpondAA-E10]RAJ41154.1 glycine betaine/proline transport system ATP-binding protein [Streptomyces sp. DpondAA-A50]SCD71080.1 glycine betaine/proline transport system ATP-binding protein [Streptomyces sp. BpilaLS-43]SCD73023.1 glycine betaine/proline transport system ATP-binding protein [Streptomyces sp. DpondAA-F4a]